MKVEVPCSSVIGLWLPELATLNNYPQCSVHPLLYTRFPMDPFLRMVSAFLT